MSKENECLTGSKNTRKSPCCCSFELEELMEEKKDSTDEKSSKCGKGSCCC